MADGKDTQSIGLAAKTIALKGIKGKHATKPKGSGANTTDSIGVAAKADLARSTATSVQLITAREDAASIVAASVAGGVTARLPTGSLMEEDSQKSTATGAPAVATSLDMPSGFAPPKLVVKFNKADLSSLAPAKMGKKKTSSLALKAESKKADRKRLTFVLPPKKEDEEGEEDDDEGEEVRQKALKPVKFRVVKGSAKKKRKKKTTAVVVAPDDDTDDDAGATATEKSRMRKRKQASRWRSLFIGCGVAIAVLIIIGVVIGVTVGKPTKGKDDGRRSTKDTHSGLR